MSFRLRVALLAGAAVAIAVVTASGVVYVVVRHQLLGGGAVRPPLRGAVRPPLVNRARDFVRNPGPGPAYGVVPLGPRANLGGPPTYLQAIGRKGEGGGGRGR